MGYVKSLYLTTLSLSKVCHRQMAHFVTKPSENVGKLSEFVNAQCLN